MDGALLLLGIIVVYGWTCGSPGRPDLVLIPYRVGVEDVESGT